MQINKRKILEHPTLHEQFGYLPLVLLNSCHFLLLYIRLFLKASLSFISIFIVRQLNKLSDRRFKCCLNYQKATWLLFCQSVLLDVEVNCPDTTPCHLYTWTLWASSALSYLWHINQIDMRGFSFKRRSNKWDRKTMKNNTCISYAVLQCQTTE